MSGRSCSAACADFFERQAAAVQKGPDRAHAYLDVALRREARLHFDKGDIRGRFDEPEKEIAMGIKLRAPWLSLSVGGALAPVPRPTDPADGRCDANPKLHRRPPGRQSRQRRVDHPVS